MRRGLGGLALGLSVAVVAAGAKAFSELGSRYRLLLFVLEHPLLIEEATGYHVTREDPVAWIANIQNRPIGKHRDLS